jgi:hypothetical protein
LISAKPPFCAKIKSGAANKKTASKQDKDFFIYLAPNFDFSRFGNRLAQTAKEF